MKQRLHKIIFESDTRSGKAFDIGIMIAILASVSVVMLDTVSGIASRFGGLFYQLEWVFTLIFSAEYILRLWVSKKPTKYIFSFFGVIDLLAILPTYLSVVIPGSQSLLVIRLLRVLRVFRILKLAQFMSESKLLVEGLKRSTRKITVFIFTVLILVIIFGSIMYTIEGGKNGFTSIPKSIYWAVVTLTTVGYGDLAPTTSLGQFIASIIMLMGYGIIAVPAGIITSELSQNNQKETTTQSITTCPSCSKTGHDPDSIYCKYCSTTLIAPVYSQRIVKKDNKTSKNVSVN